MSTTQHKRRQHGPVMGDPRLRTPVPPGTPRRRSRGTELPPVQLLGCLSTYDYLCHDHACGLWPKCPHGGNRD